MLAVFEPKDADKVFDITMKATDQNRLQQPLEVMRLRAQWNDTTNNSYGPGGQQCAHGIPIDGTPFDLDFTCDCSATRYTGANCELLV